MLMSCQRSFSVWGLFFEGATPVFRATFALNPLKYQIFIYSCFHTCLIFQVLTCSSNLILFIKSNSLLFPCSFQLISPCVALGSQPTFNFNGAFLACWCLVISHAALATRTPCPLVLCLRLIAQACVLNAHIVAPISVHRCVERLNDLLSCLTN